MLRGFRYLKKKTFPLICYSLRFDFPAQSIMPESRFLLSVGLSGLTRFASLGRGASVLFLSRSYTSACIQWAHVRPLFLLLAFASPAFLRELSSMSMCSLFRRVFGSEAPRRPRSVFVGKGLPFPVAEDFFSGELKTTVVAARSAVYASVPCSPFHGVIEFGTAYAEESYRVACAI